LEWIEEVEAGMTADDFVGLSKASGNVYREAVSLRLDVIERRRVVAAGIHCLGFQAQWARRAGQTVPCLAAVDAILAVILAPEPAERWPSFMAAGTVIANAANALLRVCTSSQSSPSMARGTPAEAGVSVSEGMVNEALARLAADARLHGVGGGDEDPALLVALVDKLAAVQWGWDSSNLLFSPMALVS
jgi:hypothetical protein